jgi:peptidoglycan/LPS O-acetylase OafA/YrhL
MFQIVDPIALAATKSGVYDPPMSGNVEKSSKARLRQLDALRGIAALFVVFNHYAQVVPEGVRHAIDHTGIVSLGALASPWFWLRYTPLRLIVDGQAAVDLFFVLSGFVLALPLTADRQPEFWPFIVRRLCRVYLPFAIVIIGIAAAYALVPTAPSAWASDWLNGLRPHPGEYSLATHLLMTGSDTSLDPPMWTLIHEVRMAAVMPLIFLMIRKVGPAQTVAAGLAISVVASFGMNESISGSWQATWHFLWMFAAGSALAFNRFELLAPARNPKATAWLWALAIILLVVPFNRVWADFLIGGGAVLLIVLCLPQGRIVSALTSPVPLWFGRVSYSLYLIHLPILILAVTGGYFAGVLPAVLLFTLALAELAFRTIEAPSHALGIMLSQMIRKSRQSA